MRPSSCPTRSWGCSQAHYTGDRWRGRAESSILGCGPASVQALISLGSRPCVLSRVCSGCSKCGPGRLLSLPAFGAFSGLRDGRSHQSLLPRVVPGTPGGSPDARLTTRPTLAATAHLGPAVGGARWSGCGAGHPSAYAVIAVRRESAATLRGRCCSTPVSGSKSHDLTRVAPRNLRREIGEGLRWIYRHRTLCGRSRHATPHLVRRLNAAAFAVGMVSGPVRRRAAHDGALRVRLRPADRRRWCHDPRGASVASSIGQRLGTGPTIFWSRATSRSPGSSSRWRRCRPRAPRRCSSRWRCRRVRLGSGELERHGVLAAADPRWPARQGERHQAVGEPHGGGCRRSLEGAAMTVLGERGTLVIVASSSRPRRPSPDSRRSGQRCETGAHACNKGDRCVAEAERQCEL